MCETHAIQLFLLPLQNANAKHPCRSCATRSHYVFGFERTSGNNGKTCCPNLRRRKFSLFMSDSISVRRNIAAPHNAATLAPVSLPNLNGRTWFEFKMCERAPTNRMEHFRHEFRAKIERISCVRPDGMLVHTKQRETVSTRSFKVMERHTSELHILIVLPRFSGSATEKWKLRRKFEK